MLKISALGDKDDAREKEREGDRQINRELIDERVRENLTFSCKTEKVSCRM